MGCSGKENETAGVMPDPLLSTKTVAGILGISERGVHRLVQQGKFPGGIDVGGKWRWEQGTLEKWVGDLRAHADSVKAASGGVA